MKNTTNSGFKKPESKDKISLTEENYNWDKLDEILSLKMSSTDDTRNNITTFGTADTFENILSGESHFTIFGKIRKLFAYIGWSTLTTVSTTISSAINELVTRVVTLENNATLVGTVGIPSTITSVTQHYVNKKNGVCQYVLRGTITTTVGTTYTLETLPSEFRPTVAFYKNIQIRDTSAVLGNLSISTDGVVTLITRTAISATTISINETFLA